MADLQVVTFDGSGRSGLAARFTDRWGGASAAPYDQANLATHVGDDSSAVASNRQDLINRLGAPVVWMEQVHGADVAVIDDAREGHVPNVDAMVTAAPGVALAVVVADCVPVLLHDAAAEVLGVAHAGRRGLAEGVVIRTVEAMIEIGAQADRVHAWLGPSICGRCYEVPAALRDEVEARAPGSATTTARGTPGLDIRAGLRRQLRALGRTGPAVRDVGPCTAESPDHYSHRRDGTTGRFAGVAVLQAR